jgi:hypothetical protein
VNDKYRNRTVQGPPAMVWRIEKRKVLEKCVGACRYPSLLSYILEKEMMLRERAKEEGGTPAARAIVCVCDLSSTERWEIPTCRSSIFNVEGLQLRDKC